MDSKFCAIFQYEKEVNGFHLPLIKQLGVADDLAGAKELCWQHRENNETTAESYYIAEYQDEDWSNRDGSNLRKINTHLL